MLNHVVVAESINTDEQDLKIVVSSKRLLRNLDNSLLVQADASYKVIWQGYPILLVGTTDRRQKFHPFALAVCKGESTEDFTFIFRALQTYKPAWHPSFLLGDACEAITAAFVQVFGVPTVRIMCFFHVRKNIEPYYRALPKVKRAELQRDVQALQTSQDADTFSVAVPLFLRKWKTLHPEFVKYFQAQWLAKNDQWFEGAALGMPSTNNGLEATNGVIKSEHTLRERLPVGQFLNCVVDIVTEWSHVRDPTSVNCVQFATTPTWSLSLWTQAFQWAAESKKVLEQSLGARPGWQKFFVASSTSKLPVSKKMSAQYEARKWNSFDQFVKGNYGLWTIRVNKNSHYESTCTCPFFLKNGACKHVLGMLIRLQLVTVPTEAKLIPLGQKRKRGRPTKAKQALLVQC